MDLSENSALTTTAVILTCVLALAVWLLLSVPWWVCLPLWIICSTVLIGRHASRECRQRHSSTPLVAGRSDTSTDA